MAAVNNFGIGGVNANALFEPNLKTTNEENLRITDTFTSDCEPLLSNRRGIQ